MWFSRRTYAFAATLACAISAAVTLMNLGDLAVVTASTAVMMLFSAANSFAVGGWLGSLESQEADIALGAWMNARNIGGFGLIAMAAIPVVRGANPLSPPWCWRRRCSCPCRSMP